MKSVNKRSRDGIASFGCDHVFSVDFSGELQRTSHLPYSSKKCRTFVDTSDEDEEISLHKPSDLVVNEPSVDMDTDISEEYHSVRR